MKKFKNKNEEYIRYLDALINAQIQLRKIMAKKDWLLAETQKGYVVKYLSKLSECKANIANYRAMLAV